MLMKQEEAKIDEIRAAEDEKKKVLVISLIAIYIHTVLCKCLSPHGIVAGAAEEEGEGKSQEGCCQGICLGCGFCGRIG